MLQGTVRALPGDVLSWVFEDSLKMRSRGSLTTTIGENHYDADVTSSQAPSYAGPKLRLTQ